MIIRHELPGDEKTIGRVTHLAFEGHPFSQGTEAAIIRDLRAAGALSLSLVCEAGGDILGHLALSPVRINDAETNWYGLGPISVLPDLQGQGVNAIILDDMQHKLIKAGVRYAETGPMLEINDHILAQWDRFSGVQHKRRRCFVKTL